MENDSPFLKVRWHLPAAAFGLQLPEGYHMLEAPLRLFLYFGDQEIAEFPAGTDPKEFERAAQQHAAGRQAPAAPPATDPITGLLWSVAAREDATKAAFHHDLHVVIIHLTGMGTLMDLYGFETAHMIMQDIAARLKGLIDERDLLTRHSGDRLLIFTTRSLDEIHLLVDLIHEQVGAVSVETDWTRLPGSRIGVATVDRLTSPDARAAAAVIDAVVLSAEVAATTAPEAEISVPVEVPAAAVQPAMPAPEPLLEGAPQVVHEPVAPVSAVEPAPQQPLEEMAAAGVGPAEARLEMVPPAPTIEMPAAGSVVVQEVAKELAADQAPEPSGRIRLKGASLDISGLVATASVKLVYGSQEVMGRAVGRNVQERRLFLVAEATARAVTEFLPAGYGVVLHDIQPTPTEVGKALWAVVLYLTPDGEESLLGIAPIDGMMIDAAGKAVLSAVNRRIEPLLGQEK